MENEKVKVLYFVDRLRHGGIQQLILEILKHMDKEKVQIDLVVFDDGETYPLEEEVKKLGINFYKLDGWIKSPFSYIKQKKVMDKFYKEHHDYKVVHLHSSSKNFFVLREAKKYGIPVRIAHSHNIGFQTKNKVKILIGNILKNALIKNSTNYFACSKLAGEWLFGDEITKSDKFKVIHNAVEYDKFKFNSEVRQNIRKELNISDDCILFGNVGRFTNQKNHTFLIDIFNEIHKLNANTKLILIGIGEKEEEIKQKVKDLEIEKDVIFAGFRKNVNEFMSVMDAFLMPSLYEGLPVVGVEAQAAGLPCFMSKDVITDEVKITSGVHFIPLEKSAKKWAEEILNSDLERKNTEEELKEAGYFIDDMARSLAEYYIKKED